jgi:hypothetical protein
MFSSILETKTDSSESNEAVPRTKLPWVWVGFILAFVFLVSEFLFFVPNVDPAALEIFLVVVVLSGLAYWLFCIYRFHKILNEMSPSGYPVSPGEAVGKHFIPIINIVWIFQWPAEMSRYLNRRGRVQMISGNIIGLFLLLATLARFVDGAVGLAFTFGVTMYLAAKLRRHIELIKGSTPDMMPPPPDKDLFGYKPELRTENNSAAAGPSATIE